MRLWRNADWIQRWSRFKYGMIQINCAVRGEIKEPANFAGLNILAPPVYTYRTTLWLLPQSPYATEMNNNRSFELERKGIREPTGGTGMELVYFLISVITSRKITSKLMKVKFVGCRYHGACEWSYLSLSYFKALSWKYFSSYCSAECLFIF